MIKANFSAYASYVTDSLYQWDINQVLSVSGLNVSTAPEVHFSNANMDKAIVRQSTLTDHVVNVKIPNSLLQDPLTIHAHIGIYEGDTFKVIERVEIPIIPRKRPADYTIETTDEEIYSFKRLENMIGQIDDKWSAFTLATVDEAVNEWLTDHPEATTTVQDGALTKNKFSDEIEIKNTLNPDMFSGDDSQKLERAFDQFEHTGGIIVINRLYTLTRDVNIIHSSNKNNRVIVKGIGKDCGIDFGEYCIKEKNNDISLARGGITFENLALTGTGKMIDFTGLIRITVNSCTLSGFENIAYSGGFIQTFNLTNCLIRSVGTVVSLETDDFVYDFHAVQNTIEWCKHLIVADRLSGCSISHNCIEGFLDVPIVCKNYALMLSVTDNYFEKNNGTNIDFSTIPQYGTLNVTISGNAFFGENKDAKIIKIPKYKTTGFSIISGNFAGNLEPALIAVPDDVENVANVYAFGNYGRILDTNGVLTGITPSDIVKSVKMADHVVDKTSNNTVTVNCQAIGVAVGTDQIYIPVALPTLAGYECYTVNVTKLSITNVGTVNNISIKSRNATSFTIEENSSKYTKGASYVCTLTAEITFN